MDLLITNAWIVTMNPGWDILRDGYVAVEGGKISEVGYDPARAEALAARAGEVIDASGKILMPGMVNAHTHLFQTFMRGLADDKPLFQWLKEEIWPFAELMSEEDFYCAALIGCLENLRTGATGVIDQHYIYTSKQNGDMVFKAMQKSGVRGCLSRCFADNDQYYHVFREREQEVLDDIRRLHEEWTGGLLSLSVGPLNPWGVTPELFTASKALADELGIKYQVHTAETRAVVERTAAMYDGMRNLEFFDSLGILDPDTQLPHSVWLDDHEIEILARTGAQPVHCPVANMYLASGVARVPEMLRLGIPVALATDGPGSNNSEDMLGTLKFTACLHKIHTLDAQVLSNEDILRMATRNGARALGLEQELGQVAPGYTADLLLVDWKKPHIAPVHKPDSALVYNANGNDVDTVIVGGSVVVRNKKSTLIDEDALVDECQQRVEFIKAKLER